MLGPFAINGGPSLVAEKPIDLSAGFEGVGGKRATWKTAKAVAGDGQIDLGLVYTHDDDRVAYGYAEVASPAERRRTRSNRR